MVVNTLNYQSVDETIEYAKNNPAIEMISINFPPFPDTEYLMIDKQLRNEIIDKVIAYKRRGYPIMNSKLGFEKDERYAI